MSCQLQIMYIVSSNDLNCFTFEIIFFALVSLMLSQILKSLCDIQEEKKRKITNTYLQWFQIK